jgi:hypothetical protein
VCDGFSISAFRSGIRLPTVEVRYLDLNIQAKAQAVGRALPTLPNAIINASQVRFSLPLGLSFNLPSSTLVSAPVSPCLYAINGLTENRCVFPTEVISLRERLFNSVVRFMQALLGAIGLNFGKKMENTILHNVSGIIKPGRLVVVLEIEFGYL